MNLTELYSYFNNQITNHVLSIIDEEEHTNHGFQSLLKHIKESSLEVLDCVLELNPAVKPEFLIIKGKAKLSPLNAGDFFNVIFTCSLKEEQLHIIMKAEITAKVSFQTFFSSLYPTSVYKENEYELAESELKDIIIQNPVITFDSENIEPEKVFGINGKASFENCSGNWGIYKTILAASFSFSGYLSLVDRFTEEKITEFDLSVNLLSPFSFLPISDNPSDGDTFSNTKLKLSLYNKLKESNKYIMLRQSGADFACDFEFKNLTSVIQFSLPLFDRPTYWYFESKLENGLSIGDIIYFFASLFQIEKSQNALLIPVDSFLNTFRLYYIGIGVEKPSDSFHLSLRNMNVTLESKTATKILPFLTLNNLKLDWEMLWGGKDSFGKVDYLLEGEIASDLEVDLFGDKKLNLISKIYLPTFDIEASLIFSEFTSSSADLPDLIGDAAGDIPGDGAVVALAKVELYASYQQRMLNIRAEAKDVLSFSIGTIDINLAEIYASAAFSQSSKEFVLGGKIQFKGSEEDSKNNFAIALEGSYKDAVWNFKGAISEGQVNIGSLISEFIGQDYASEDQWFEIVLSEFDIDYTYKKNAANRFSLTAAFDAAFGKKIFKDIEVGAGGKISLITEKGKTTFLSVMLSLRAGGFQIAAQVDDFYSEHPKYLVQVNFQDSYIKGAYFEQNGKEFITISLQNITLGSLISAVASFINPNKKFVLPSPWDILNKIDLSKISLQINLTDKNVDFKYQLDLDILGLMKINSIGIQYNYGKGNGIEDKISMFIDADGKTLSWDPLNDSPPSNVGQSKAVFYLSYLGMAQHFTSEGVKKADSIGTAMEELKSKFKPIDGEIPSNVQYDPESNWLFGADFTINSALRARIVLNDPFLYGLVITVEGDKAPFGIFKGLMLELLYKKITKDIGMFKATLLLPEKFRRFELGVLSVTLGQVSFEVYTNGDFLIDLGFPHNNDFSKSFVLEAAIFTGRGGFYFGKLSGATCPKLPAIEKGSFDTVITLGVGLSIGIGRSFDFGIVSGGLSLEVFGIFEGLFAVYHPEESSKEDNSLYYRAQATIGIIGRLFLKLDLKIISIEASLGIMSYAKAVLESYKPILIELDLKLTMRAKIKILFIKINFSFTFHANFKFTIGQESTPPWVSKRKARSFPFRGTPFMTQALSEKKHKIKLEINPIFSLAENKESQKEYCVAFIPTIKMEDYAEFIKLISKWILYRFEDTVGFEFNEIMTPELLEKELNYNMLYEFFQQNAEFILTQSDFNSTSQTEAEGTVFPMLPPLELNFTGKQKDTGKTDDIPLEKKPKTNSNSKKRLEMIPHGSRNEYNIK